MRAIVMAGVVLGILVAVWTYVMGFTGWYKDPVMLNLFVPVAIVINIAVIIWGLRNTMREGRGYGGQVVAGLLIGVIGAVLIFFNSILCTAVVFPEYFQELQVAYGEMLRNSGYTEQQIQAELAAGSQTTLSNALIGAVATVITSVLLALITAAFVRSKPS